MLKFGPLRASPQPRIGPPAPPKLVRDSAVPVMSCAERRRNEAVVELLALALGSPPPPAQLCDGDDSDEQLDPHGEAVHVDSIETRVESVSCFSA